MADIEGAVFQVVIWDHLCWTGRQLTINAKTELMLKAKGIVEENLTYLQQTSNKLNLLQTVVPNHYSFQELLGRCAK